VCLKNLTERVDATGSIGNVYSATSRLKRIAVEPRTLRLRAERVAASVWVATIFFRTQQSKNSRSVLIDNEAGGRSRYPALNCSHFVRSAEEFFLKQTAVPTDSVVATPQTMNDARTLDALEYWITLR
jgi:hypothetical protein